MREEHKALPKSKCTKELKGEAEKEGRVLTSFGVRVQCTLRRLHRMLTLSESERERKSGNQDPRCTAGNPG
jgi:hypothetical protein